MYHRLLLGYTIMHLILKAAVLRGFITEPPPSSRPFVVETYLILESELVNRTERRGNNAKEYAAFVMEVTPEDDYAVFTDGNIVDAPKTLGNVANHAKSNIEMQRADAVIYLVGRDMIHRRPDGSTFVSHGLAFTKGACTTHNVVIAADNGKKYTGAMSVAHEIGHLIGSSHDGSKFAPDCPRNAGTIMVPQAVGEIRARFSNCSRDAISTFLKTRGKCLFEESSPVLTTSATEVTATTMITNTLDDEKYQKMMRRKCEKFLKFLAEGYLLSSFQLDDKDVTCNILCTAASESSYDVMHYAAVAPNGIPCDKADPLKECKRGQCV